MRSVALKDTPHVQSEKDHRTGNAEPCEPTEQPRFTAWCLCLGEDARQPGTTHASPAHWRGVVTPLRG
jgi:hypothetical protein